MPKRRHDEKISVYQEKIRRLQEEAKRNIPRKRVIIYSDSSDDASVENSDNERPVIQNENELSSREPLPSTSADHVTVPAEDAPPELAPEYLEALGDRNDDVPKFGEPIHENLAQRWEPILKKGLSKEHKDSLLKQYLVPSNCKLLQAPTLNPEISAAVTEALRSRDKKLEEIQQQLGLGITAVNKAVSLLLTGDDKLEAIKILSDANRILTDLHHNHTSQRVKLLTPSLDKTIVTHIKDVNRDEYIFGSDLSAKIKAAKTIEKQGVSIKKFVPAVKTTSSTLAASTNRSRQGNWSGPPRAQSSRGGRGGYRTTGAPRAPTTTTATTGSAQAHTRATQPAHSRSRNRAPRRY